MDVAAALTLIIVKAISIIIMHVAKERYFGRIFSRNSLGIIINRYSFSFPLRCEAGMQ